MPSKRRHGYTVYLYSYFIYTAMIIEVRLMRYQGRRLPWKEIDHGKVFRGNLQTVCSPGSDRPVEAHLLAVNGVAKRLIPDLHEPAFLGVCAATGPSRLSTISPEKCQLNFNVALLAYFHGLNIVPSCRMISDLLLYLVGPLSLFVAAALYLLGKRKP